jgi:sugar phosphate isomerase/epimerase
MKFVTGASYIFTKEYDLEGFIEFASKEGFDFVQLGYEAPLKWIGEVTKSRRERIRSLAKRLGLQVGVHSVANGINVAWTNTRLREESLRQIKEAIDFTHDVGGELLTIHPGWKDLFGYRYPDDAYALAIEGHRELADFASGCGVRIGVENMPPFWLSFCDGPKETLAMVQTIDRENFGMTLDIGHANLLGAEAIEEFIVTLNRKIFLIHIHDNDGKGDQHRVIGEGTVDFRRVIALLTQNGINVPLSIESHNLQDLAKSKEVFKRFCPEQS